MKSNFITLGCFCFLINSVIGIDRGPVTSDEKELLDKLRNELTDEGKNDPDLKAYPEKWLGGTTDILLVNWLRYSDNDLEKTKELINKSLKWRLKNNMDNIINWEPPKYFKENNFRYKVTGYAKNGQPVLYVPFGTWNFRAAIQEGLRDDLVRLDMQIFEVALEKLNKSETIGNFIWIVDMNKFTLAQVTSLRVLSTTGIVVGLWENNWPFTPSDIFIINSPGYFSVMFEVVKRVLSAKSLEPIQIHSDYPKELIEDVIGKEALPKSLGGLVDF